jgi:hypothetical protein
VSFSRICFPLSVVSGLSSSETKERRGNGKKKWKEEMKRIDGKGRANIVVTRQRKLCFDTPQGRDMRKEVWAEICQILEAQAPGVVENAKA